MSEQSGLVVCFGEAMIRHSQNQIGESCSTPGGSEYNVAAALSLLGRKTTWVSSLPDDEEAKLVTTPLVERSVTLDIYQSSHQVNHYSIDSSAKTVTYDRSDSAFANLDAGEINWRQLLSSSRWLVISGITPMLSDGARANWAAAMTFAELDGTLIALDLNYRPALGTFQELWDHVEPRLRMVNLLVVSPQTLALVMGNDSLDDLIEMRRRWNIPYLACTWKNAKDNGQSRWSAVAHSHGLSSSENTAVFHQPVEHLGGGDAWLAGFIDGLLEGIVLEDCCHRGDLLAALTQRTFGDLGNVTRDELSRWESIEGPVVLLQDG